jgi:hypothetical protein
MFSFTPRANATLQIVGQECDRNQGGMCFVKNFRNTGGKQIMIILTINVFRDVTLCSLVDNDILKERK